MLYVYEGQTKLTKHDAQMMQEMHEQHKKVQKWCITTHTHTHIDHHRYNMTHAHEKTSAKCLRDNTTL